MSEAGETPTEGHLSLPVDSLKEAVAFLRRPFTPEAVKFKIQTNPRGANGRAMIVTFIDARLVSERLNMVCPHLWETEFVPVDGGMMCKLTVDGKTRRDVGSSSGTDTDIGLKALYSDAFKRAAVHFGVGASLYTLPRVFVEASRLKKVERQGKDPSWYITPATEQSLQGGYRAWLEGAGVTLFGAALSHGDLGEATGDTEGEPPVLDGESHPATTAPGTPPKPPTDVGTAKGLLNVAKAAGVGGEALSMWLSSQGVVHEPIKGENSAVAALQRLKAEQVDALYQYLEEQGKPKVAA